MVESAGNFRKSGKDQLRIAEAGDVFCSVYGRLSKRWIVRG